MTGAFLWRAAGKSPEGPMESANNVIQGTFPAGGRRSGMQVRLARGARRSGGSPHSVHGSRISGRVLAALWDLVQRLINPSRTKNPQTPNASCSGSHLRESFAGRLLGAPCQAVGPHGEASESSPTPGPSSPPSLQLGVVRGAALALTMASQGGRGGSPSVLPVASFPCPAQDSQGANVQAPCQEPARKSRVGKAREPRGSASPPRGVAADEQGRPEAGVVTGRPPPRPHLHV